MFRPLILACVVLTGCTTYQPKPISPAQLAKNFDNRSLASNALRTYMAKQVQHKIEPWPLTSWNSYMLTLAAYYYSPVLDVVRTQWGSAKANIDVASTVPNPTLQLPFAYTTNNQSAARPYTTGIALDIPIETAHKREYRIDQATQLSEAAGLNLANEAWAVRSQVRNALLDIYAVQERIVFLTKEVMAQQQLLAMVRKRKAIGENTGPNVDQALLTLTQVQISLLAAQNGLHDARARLAGTIGVPIAALDSVKLNVDEFNKTDAAPPSSSAQRTALFHRVDLLSSLAKYEATQAALQLEIAKQYPDIHIGLGYTYDVGANKIGFGLPGITLPIFDHNQGGIALAEAKRTEAAANTAALQDKIINDLDHALAHYRKSLEVLHLSATLLSTAKKKIDSQAESLAAGATDRLSFTQAKADYQTNEIEHLNAVVAAQHAAGALEDAMHRPISPSISDQITRKEAAIQ
ncbi:MAG: TolC family protein [Paralcaligenes sp.]